jgi:lysyl-tRNA synthetase class 1
MAGDTADVSNLTPVELTAEERRAVVALREEIRERFAEHDDKTLAEAIYRIAEEEGLEAKTLFQAMYRVLIGQSKGPRLAGFLLTIGRERVLALLALY